MSSRGRAAARAVAVCLALLLLMGGAYPVGAGEDTRRAENEARGQPLPLQPRPSPALPAAPAPAVPAPPPAAGPTLAIRDIALDGSPEDLALFCGLRTLTPPAVPLETRLRALCTAAPVAAAQLVRICREFTAAELLARHYLLAYIAPVGTPDAGAVQRVLIRFGAVGLVRIADEPDFRGRYFSQPQILNSLELKSGDRFDYSALHRDLWRLSENGDLTVDTTVKARHDDAVPPRQTADITLAVRERCPVHGEFQAGNYGTKDTGRARYEGALSYANLTRHFDTLTMRYGTGDSRDEFESWSAQYRLPLNRSRSLTLALFGGHSETETDEIMPLLRAAGSSSFGGFELSQEVLKTDRHRLAVAGGRVWRQERDRSLFGGLSVSDTHLRAAPFDLGLYYDTPAPDRLGGTNAASVLLVLNSSRLDGSSDGTVFADAGAEPDYRILRWRTSRRQALPWRDAYLLPQFAGQYSPDALPAAEQYALGGQFTVRGYEEDEFQADTAVLLNVELGSPSARLPIAFPGQAAASTRMTARLVAFYDLGRGCVNRHDPGVTDGQTLESAGIGTRLSLGTHAELRLDYGWPLQPTDNSTRGGRLHVLVTAWF